MSTLREIMGFAIRYGGLPSLIRNTVARDKATIVLYHNPSRDNFERHLRYLSKTYAFVTLNNLVQAIHARDWSTIPPRSLVITFDDGHRGNYDLLSIMKKYGVRPTIYLVTRVVGTDRHFWFVEAGEQSEKLKKYPNDRRLEFLQERLDFTPTKEFPPESRQALNVSEIEEMSEWVDFQSHTCFHPNLTTCTDGESKREMRDSREDLLNLLGGEIRHLSYPNGDYSDREIRLARELGYASGRTIDVGWNDVNADPYLLRITGVTDDASVNILAAQLSGITMYARYALGGSWTGRHRTARSLAEGLGDGSEAGGGHAS